MASSISAWRRFSPPVRVTPLLPRRGLAAAADRTRSLPRTHPRRPRRTRQPRRLAGRRPALRLPPRGAVLVEQLRHGLLHPQRELLMRLALAREQRLSVPNADRRPSRLRPRATLWHRLVRADDGDRHDRHVHLDRQPRRPMAEALEPAVLRAGAFGEHD